jgi:perosamine synthetase
LSLAGPPPAAPADVHALSYRLFDPSNCGFPEPRVPLLPMLTGNAFDAMQAPSEFEIVGYGHAPRVYTRGRYALYDAYRLAGVGTGGALLAPAYHCRTMLDPAISLGAPVLLYPVTPSLEPDLAALDKLVRAARVPVRAMLLTHYFGLGQDAARAQAFCAERGIALVEDCSHALFNLRSQPRLGRYGTYTVASPYKLLPCEEGGLLFAGDGAVVPAERPRPAGLRAELRVLRSAVQRRLARGGGAATLGNLDAEFARLATEPATPALESTAQTPEPSRLYVASEEGRAAPRTARWLMKLCSINNATRRRRANYLRWRDSVRRLPHCRALFPELPSDCVPYMFPLLIDLPERHFHALKRLGMPIWRWDEMAISDCPVATRYSRQLLHLPCHQALSDQEFAWMLEALTLVMNERSHATQPPATPCPR